MHSSTMLKTTRELLCQRNIIGAEQLLDKIKDHTPEWHYLKGQVSLLKGWYMKAHSHFLEAIHKEPDNLEYQDSLKKMQSQNQSFMNGNHEQRQQRNDSILSKCCDTCGCGCDCCDGCDCCNGCDCNCCD